MPVKRYDIARRFEFRKLKSSFSKANNYQTNLIKKLFDYIYHICFSTGTNLIELNLEACKI